LGFRVAPETIELMQEIVAAGEVAHLVPERVWQETESALSEEHPEMFFSVLRDCGALAVVFPEVEALFGVPQPERWHPEIDTGVHVLMALAQSARLSQKAEVRFAVLVHDLGKGTTPRQFWPKHSGHEERSVKLADALCDRLGAPNRFRELGAAVARYHGVCHLALELRPSTIHRVLEGIDALRRPERFEDFLAACEADARGRKGLEAAPYPQAALFREAFAAAARVEARPLVEQGLTGPQLGQALREARIAAIAAARQDFGRSSSESIAKIPQPKS
jgi:tRNA nucleotidyltransferase (CCA-adding enzyme)